MNENVVNLNTNIASTINSNSSVDNNISVDSGSGNNNIEKNSSVASFESGTVDGAVNLINLTGSVLNPESSFGEKNIDPTGKNSIALDPSSSREKISSLNQLSGPQSVNLNSSATNNIIGLIKNTNQEIENNINLIADTGHNILNQNTMIGKVSTGSINLAVNIINLQNLIDPNFIIDLDFWSILGSFGGNLVIPNSISALTGPDSINHNNASSSDNQKLESTNQTRTNNAISLASNTGENNISENSYVGDVATGQTKVDGKVINIDGSSVPLHYIINVFGKWTGIIPPEYADRVIVNEITGPNSLNQNTDQLTNYKTVVADSTTDINNSVNIRANTGNNQISKNTAVGNVTTGDINIIGNIANIINSIGQKTSRLRLGVINIYGDWSGTFSSMQQKKLTPTEPPVPLAVNSMNQMPKNNSLVTADFHKLDNSALVSSNLSRIETPSVGKIDITGNNKSNSLKNEVTTKEIESPEVDATDATTTTPTTEKIRFLFWLLSGSTLLGLMIRKIR